MAVAFPAELPCVSRIDGYGFLGAAALQRTPFEAGNTRQRRAHVVLPQQIALCWRARNDTVQPLVNWLNQHGFDWFTLPLAGVESSGALAFATDITVRLATDLQLRMMQFYRENWWTVQAAAEYAPVEFLLDDGDWVDGLTPAAHVDVFAIGRRPGSPAPVYLIGGRPGSPSSVVF